MPLLGVVDDNEPRGGCPPAYLNVGLEVEILLRPKDRDMSGQTLDVLTEYLSTHHNTMIPRGQRKMHSDLRGNWEGERFAEWSLTVDKSIKGGDETNNIYGIEIISPIMRFDESNAYQGEVRYMFSKMQGACSLVTNESCATHVHLSPGEGIWQTKELKRICKAILYFEEAMEVLVPAARRRSKFCRSNRFNNPQFTTEADGDGPQARGMTECFRTIEKCRDVQSLAETMGMRKFMAWNFVNVFYCGWSDDGGTIEFRRPPGVTDPDDCLAWVELAVYFVHAARQLQDPGFRLDAQYARDVAGLGQFIQDGLLRARGTPEPRYLQRLFHGRSGRIAPVISQDQLAHDSGSGLAEAQRGAPGGSTSPGRGQGLESRALGRSRAGRSGLLSVITGQALGGLLSPCAASPRSVVALG